MDYSRSNKSFLRPVAFLLLVLCSSMELCMAQEAAQARGEYLPQAPDYSDTTQWYVTDRGAAVDLFYVISTETGDYRRADGTPCHFADTYADSLRRPLYGEMLGVDTLLSGRLNYFSPYYRQCSLQTFTSDSTAAVRRPVAVGDARRAFSYYLSHLNQGRRFILAGFSQGAGIVLQLLTEMDESVYRRMVAAYVIGNSVSALQARNPHVRPARGAADSGVTICYNSVRTPESTIFPRSAFAINPVNWRTDDTPATLVTEPTPWKPVDRQKKDTMTVTLDPVSRLLIVRGYTATDYMLPLRGKEGNYHTREIWLYRNELRRNMALRAGMDTPSTLSGR